MKKMALTASLLALSTARLSAFDGGKAGWKLDADGKIVMQDGNPVYVDNNGQESTVAGDTITRLNGEARQHRIDKETALAKLKDFEGLDAKAAREAIEKLGNLNLKDMIDKGELDKVKQQISEQYSATIAEKDKTNADLTKQLDSLYLSNAFNSSEFVKNRVAVPVEMFQSQFGGNFKREDGKLIPYDANGNKVFSPKRMGEIASFDEAIEIFVGNYAFKDQILKAPKNGGTGGNGNGGGRQGERYISRAEFDKLPQHEQAATAAAARKGEVTLGD